MQRASLATSVLIATLALGWLGCEGRAEPALEGVPCYRVQECQRGLICLEGICTTDVSSSVPEGAGTPLELGNELPDSSDAGSRGDDLDAG